MATEEIAPKKRQRTGEDASGEVFRVNAETNLFALVAAAMEGISPEVVFRVTGDLEIHNNDIGEILHISAKTLRNYQQDNKKLNPSLSEHVLKMDILYQKGMEVFGDQASLMRWLRKPSFGLEGQIPVNLMKTSGGIDLIIEELDRIAYGDFS